MKNKYIIWFSETMIKIGRTMFKKPEIKRTKELEENLIEARNDQILISEKEMSSIQNAR